MECWESRELESKCILYVKQLLPCLLDSDLVQVFHNLFLSLRLQSSSPTVVSFFYRKLLFCVLFNDRSELSSSPIPALEPPGLIKFRGKIDSDEPGLNS